MAGDGNPYNRKSMPWDEIAEGEYDSIIKEVKAIIALRTQYNQLNGEKTSWKHEDNHKRLIHYVRTTNEIETAIEVYLNASDKEVEIPVQGNVIYGRNYKNGYIQENGILILETKKDKEMVIC